jgi:hypothetical protein
MQAHKLSGKVNQDGQLIITEAIDLPPGEVKVIVLQKATESTSEAIESLRVRPTKIRFLRDWFAKTEPVPSDFDADEARWQALKEKHDL